MIVLIEIITDAQYAYDMHGGTLHDMKNTAESKIV